MHVGEIAWLKELREILSSSSWPKFREEAGRKCCSISDSMNGESLPGNDDAPQGYLKGVRVPLK